MAFVGMVILASQVDWAEDPIYSAALPFLLVVEGFIFFVAPLLIVACTARPTMTTLVSVFFLGTVILMASGTSDPSRKAVAPTPPAPEESKTAPRQATRKAAESRPSPNGSSAASAL